MPHPRCLVRCRTSLTPILRITSGCALTQGPRDATSRNGDIVGIDRRLGVNAKRRQLFEDAVKAIILGICGSPRLAVAPPENCDPIVFHIGHVVSLEVIATAIMRARITVRTASIAKPQAL